MRHIVRKFFVVLVFTIFISIFSYKSLALTEENTQKIFSLGRGLGSSYYYLTELYDSGKVEPYSNLEYEYGNAFQSLNIIDIILDDIETSTNSRYFLHNLRMNFYNSLQDRDLNEISIFYLREAFVDFYKGVSGEINEKFSSEGNWLLALGFYSSFQAESLGSPRKQKLLLSGFHKILNTNPLNLPESVSANLRIIEALDKNILTVDEIKCLNNKIIEIIAFFDNYPYGQVLPTGIKDIVGVWYGVLTDPDNKSHKIKLTVGEDMKIKMNIEGIADSIIVSDFKSINKYLTFMFKPFGSQKLYMKFNAKISNNMFIGEVDDVLGQRGNWLLSKTEKQ